MEKLHKQTIIEKSCEYIQLWEKQFEVWSAIKDGLKDYEGKVLNRRIVSKINKIIGEGYTVSFESQFSWYGVAIWGNGIKYDNAIRIMFGYKERTNVFKMDLMVVHTKGYESIPERIDQLKLKLAKLDQYLERYEQIRSQIKGLSDEVGNIYPLSVYFSI